MSRLRSDNCLIKEMMMMKTFRQSILICVYDEKQVAISQRYVQVLLHHQEVWPHLV